MYTLSVLNGFMRAGSHLEIKKGDGEPAYLKLFDEHAGGVTIFGNGTAVSWTKSGKIVLIDLERCATAIVQKVDRCSGIIPIAGGQRLLVWAPALLEVLDATSLESMAVYTAVDIGSGEVHRLFNSSDPKPICEDGCYRQIRIELPPVENSKGKIVAAHGSTITTFDLEKKTAVVVSAPIPPFELQLRHGNTTGFMSISPDGRYAVRYDLCAMPIGVGAQPRVRGTGRVFGRKGTPSDRPAHPDDLPDGMKRRGVGLELWSLDPFVKVRSLSPALWLPSGLSPLAMSLDEKWASKARDAVMAYLSNAQKGGNPWLAKIKAFSGRGPELRRVTESFVPHVYHACYRLLSEVVAGKRWQPEVLPELIEQSLGQPIWEKALFQFRELASLTGDARLKRSHAVLLNVLSDPVGNAALLDAIFNAPRDMQGYAKIDIADPEVRKWIMSTLAEQFSSIRGIGWDCDSSGFWVALSDNTLRHVGCDGSASARVGFERPFGTWDDKPLNIDHGSAVSVLGDGSVEARTIDHQIMRVPPKLAARALAMSPTDLGIVPASQDGKRGLLRREFADQLLEPPPPGAHLAENESTLVAILAAFAEELDADFSRFIDDIHFQSAIEIDGRKYCEPDYGAFLIEHRPKGATIVLRGLLMGFLSGLNESRHSGLPVRMDDTGEPALAYVVVALLVLDDGEKGIAQCLEWAALRDGSWDSHTFMKTIPAILDAVGFRDEGIVQFVFRCIAEGGPGGYEQVSLWRKQGLREASAELLGPQKAGQLFAREYFENKFRRDLNMGLRIDPRDIAYRRSGLTRRLDSMLEPVDHEGDSLFGNDALDHFDALVESLLHNGS